MIAVIFEAQPRPGQTGAYLNAAAHLRPLLAQIDGFISIERFESLTEPGKILSLSYWRDEEAVRQWRNVDAHRRIQGEQLKRHRLCRRSGRDRLSAPAIRAAA